MHNFSLYSPFLVLHSPSPINCSLFPVPCSLFPVSFFLLRCSLFPAPCSLVPVPCSLFPFLLFSVPCSLLSVVMLIIMLITKQVDRLRRLRSLQNAVTVKEFRAIMVTDSVRPTTIQAIHSDKEAI